ncbi:MAG: hypothetical protein JRJ12_08870 [Deltaproteobacteria bacterium]|nr:hypothetical protein [Deltaproteobacteria bacterium]MBW2071945.1 hypothetical protein [Deltaproteobacteria bacterium]
MSLTELLVIWPGSPLLSVLTWIVVAVLLLYLARTPAHRAIQSLSRAVHSGMRLASHSVLLAEQRLVQRNKEVLLAAGREAVERSLEREFHRVNAVVRRDFSGYPALHRSLAEQIARIEEDYLESVELPPPSPEWVEAVEAVAKLPGDSRGTVDNILREIHKSATSQYKGAMEEYRQAVGNRHAILKKMMPCWRKVSQTLDEVGKTITGLHDRARIIDKKMDEYEEILAKTDKAEQMLTASSTTQFLISVVVMLIAIGGAVINFNLIALPMSEMVGGGSYIGNFKTANVAALVIILVEIAMGLFLMEALGITNLFPLIRSMNDKMRVRMIWVTFAILLIMASIESALAFMRDQIAADIHALRQSLADVEAVGMGVNRWIPMVGQMVMGFILPFALTFVAIPLETFVQSSRTVVGNVLAAVLRWFAFVLRLLGNIARYSGELFAQLYDLLIFPPLWVEQLIFNRRHHPDIIVEKEA